MVDARPVAPALTAAATGATCPRCRATALDDGWCARCQRPVQATCPCGAPTASDGWCPRCGDVVTPPTRSAPPLAPYVAPRGPRFAATQVTFGPIGRVLASAAVVGVPGLLLLVVGARVQPSIEGSIGPVFGYAFALLWWSTITPWALRDLWRDARGRERG